VGSASAQTLKGILDHAFGALPWTASHNYH
jgi:hypothetical protein